MTNTLRRRTILTSAAMSPLAVAFCCAKASPNTPQIGGADFGTVRTLVDQLTEEGKIAGGAVRIAVNGEPLLEHYSGLADLGSGKPITADTIYRAYSMTKPVTAAAIMALVDDGKIKLDDPVAETVPEFTDLKAFVPAADGKLTTEPAETMRVMDLLTHTSGISNSWNPGPVAPLYRKAGLVSAKYVHDPSFKDGLADFARRMAKIPLQFQPGSQWLYSFSPDIAGLVVERVSGESFGSFLKSRFFDPLGMKDTDFYIPAEKAELLASMYALKDGALLLAEAAAGSVFLKKPFVESGAAGLLCTLDDYGRFADMLAGLGERRGVRVLSEKSTGVMMSPHIGADILGPVFQKFMGFASGGSGLGMGMALGGAVLVDPGAAETQGLKGEYTWGGAASTTFFSVPERGLSATLMTQLFPSGTLPLREMLKTAVYGVLG